MNPELVGKTVEELTAFKSRAENNKIIKQAELAILDVQVVIDKANKNREIDTITERIGIIQQAIDALPQ